MTSNSIGQPTMRAALVCDLTLPHSNPATAAYQITNDIAQQNSCVASHELLTGASHVPFHSLDMERLKVNYRVYMCPVCYKHIRGDKQDFGRHYMVHSGEKPQSCPYCSFKCIRKKALSKHLETKHGVSV